MDFNNNGNGQQINITDNQGNVVINMGSKDGIAFKISYPENLIPRRDMLDKLNNVFESHSCVLISGIGGMGKTSLAYLYAKEKQFKNVAKVIVNGRIEDAYWNQMAIPLFNNEDERESFMQNPNNQEKNEIVKHILSKIDGNNLLILDINTNNEEIKQEIETELYNYLPAGDWKTLVLTRTHPENDSVFARIEMDKMTENDAKNLFKNNWKRKQITFTDEQLAEIVKELYNHPLLIEQTAIVFSKGHEKTSAEIIEKIKSNSKVKNKVTEPYLKNIAAQDKEQQNIYTYLINLCNIDNLSKEEIAFLAVYVTWPEEPIDYDVIETLMPNNDDHLDSLVEKGILSRNDTDQYSIHSLMANVLREQIDIKTVDYTEYLNNIENILANNQINFVIHKYSKCIASSFINYDICEVVDLFSTFLLQLSTVNDPFLYNLPNPEYSKKLNKMEGIANKYQLAHLYNAEARVDYFINNYIDAKNHNEKALQVIDTMEENDDNLELKGAVLNDLAMLEEDLNEHQSAHKHLNEVLMIFRRLPKSPNNLNNLAAILSNRAIFEEETLKNLSLSKIHKQEALEIRRKLPKSLENLSELAKLLNNYASLDRKLNDFDSALKHLEEAFKIINELPETPVNSDMKANNLAGLGEINRIIGDIDTAQTNYQEALEIRKKMPMTPKNLEKLATIYEALGFLERSRRNLLPAHIFLNAAKEIFNQLNNKSETDYLEYVLNSINL